MIYPTIRFQKHPRVSQIISTRYIVQILIPLSYPKGTGPIKPKSLSTVVGYWQPWLVSMSICYITSNICRDTGGSDVYQQRPCAYTLTSIYNILTCSKHVLNGPNDFLLFDSRWVYKKTKFQEDGPHKGLESNFSDHLKKIASILFQKLYITD